MKKLMSFALCIVMLFSVMALSACSKKVSVADITKPGTYQLSKENYSRYISTVSNGFGTGRTYVSKLDTYGYDKVGFALDIFFPYKYDAEFNDVKITYEITYMFDVYVSMNNTKSYTNASEIESIKFEPETVTITLDKSGVTRYEFTESKVLEVAVAHNNYCQLGFAPKAISVEVKEISGSVTILPR